MKDPLVKQAWDIVQQPDRSDAQLDKLKALAAQAKGEAVRQIGNLIEAFIADL